jgi:hypothetical protein
MSASTVQDAEGLRKNAATLFVIPRIPLDRLLQKNRLEYKSGVDTNV